MVLADDYQPIVAKVGGILGEEFELIGTAENGNEAVDSVLTLNADVLVTDLHARCEWTSSCRTAPDG